MVWKTRDKTWTHTLKRERFHQLLSFHKDETENVSGSRVKRWWWRGDIKVTKSKSTFECWVKSPTGAPGKAQESIKTFLTTPSQNFGKDIYIIDLDDHEKTYWLATESGLLGAFHFDGDSPSQRAVGFALMSGGSRRRGHELESPGVSSPVRMLRSSPRPRESTVFDR